MTFEKYACWKPENFRQIVHTEAEASPDDVFLSVHTNNQITLKKIDGRSYKITYKEFLDEFLSDDYGNNVSSVIEGESGAGKSHFVQWLRLHIPKTDNRYILTIPKSQTNLYSVLKMLIDMLPKDKNQEFISKLEQRDTELTNDTQRVHVLLNSLATSIITDQAKSDEEEYLIPLLPKIFTDPYFRDTFFPNNNLIKNLISLIFLDSSSNRNLENKQEFTYEDLPLNATQATHAAMPTQEILDAMNDEELLSISLNIINRNLDKAISKSLNFTPNDLIELMYEIRKYLGTLNKELVLLIEDFAQLQGLDTSLLQTLTVEGDKTLCQIRWAMAVTTGYYEKLEDTVRTRMVLKVNMDNLWDKTNQKKQTKYILNLSSKYLNSIRLGKENIELWFENYNIETSLPNIPNKCDSCDFKVICHESFGEINGIGLYPFNSISLIQMAEKADIERSNTFRPRIFLNKVLHRNLNQDSVDLLRNGLFPDEDLLKDFSVKNLDFDEIDKLRMVDSLNYSRRLTLLEIWTDSKKIVNLPEGLHKAFNIPLLKNIEIISVEEKDNEKNIEIEIQSIEDLKEISKTDKFIENIENWARGDDLRDYDRQKVASLIFDNIKNNLEWDFLPISKGNIKFEARQIYIIGQQTSKAKRELILEIDRTPENAVIIKTLYNFSQTKKIDSNFEYLVRVQNKIDEWTNFIFNEIKKLYAPKRNWDPLKASLELIIIDCITNNKDFSTINFLTKSELPIMYSNEFNSLLKSVFGNDFKNIVLLENLKGSYSGRKGGQITDSFFDVSKIFNVIKEMKNNNFILNQDPIQEDRAEFDDIKNKYQLWKNNFNNALTEEVSTRLNYLEKIKDKVIIEDISQSFRNKINNLIQLLNNSGNRTHVTNNLNNLLGCNFNQVKNSFLSISKLEFSDQSNILIELFPTRKNETLDFVNLIEEINLFLNRVEETIKQSYIEFGSNSDTSKVIEEIQFTINDIDNSLSLIVGDEYDCK
jgi:hypothetical protein